RDAGGAGVPRHTPADPLTPEDRKRGGDRFRTPAVVPTPEQRDRLSQLCLQRVGRCLIVRREQRGDHALEGGEIAVEGVGGQRARSPVRLSSEHAQGVIAARSEEHTSELQSRGHLVCRLLLEKKKK